jgi:hypothetical protein
MLFTSPLTPIHHLLHTSGGDAFSTSLDNVGGFCTSVTGCDMAGTLAITQNSIGWFCGSCINKGTYLHGLDTPTGNRTRISSPAAAPSLPLSITHVLRRCIRNVFGVVGWRQLSLTRQGHPRSHEPPSDVRSQQGALVSKHRHQQATTTSSSTPRVCVCV